MSNHQISSKLLEYARTLNRGTNLFRVRAYRHAAMVVQRLDRPVSEYPHSELSRVPGIGEHLAFTIETLALTGRFVPWSGRHRAVA